MGLNIDNNPSAGAALDSALQNVTGNQPQQQQQRPQSNYGSGRTQSVLNDRNRLFGRTTAGELVSKYAETIKKIIAENIGDRHSDVKVTILDNKAKMTLLSGIILSYRTQGLVVFHRLLVEGSGAVPVTQLPINNRTYDRVNTAGDVDNRLYVEKCLELVRNEWPNIQNIEDGGSQVLPIELDTNDTDRLRQVLFNAFSALQSITEELLELTEPFSIPTHIERTDILTARSNFHPMPSESATGLPIRSDVALVLTASTNTSADLAQNQSAILTRIDGYINLEYQAPPPPAYGHPPSNRYYVPHFIMTRLTSQTNTESLEQQLFALTVATMLNKGRWSDAFKPRIDHSGSVNLRDIGAIGLEIPALTTGNLGTVGSRIDTNSTTFSNDRLIQLIHETFHEGMIYSLDVEECGDLSWLNNVFIAAATGNQNAINHIYTAANNLTAGEFGRQFGNNGLPLVIDSGNRIHLGYYTDELGNRRDLRDIDYLAMLNLNGDKGLESAHAWAATFENTHIPEDIRLIDRMELMKAVNPNVVLKGYARRISFSAPFMSALDVACRNVGLVIRNGTGEMYIGSRQRGFTNMEMLAVAPSVGSVFQNTGPQYNGGQRYQAPVGRWSR